MNWFKALGCRIVQAAFRAVLPLLPYRSPRLLGSCQEIGEACKREGVRSVLIVTGPTVRRHGLTESVERVLNEQGIAYTVYDGTQPDPTVENVEEGVALYQKNGCRGLIAIGGGSPMDCAKAIGARVAYPNKSLRRMKGVLRVLRKIPPLIAIPTTAGTGSETTLAAVITDPQHHRKYAMMSFSLIPRYAVLDASLTESLPPHVTATTGMDALTHAIEAYLGRSTTTETRRLATESVALVFEHIEHAYADGHNRKAREGMLLASYKAGIAFSKSYVGYIHALAHALGGTYGVPHGLANAVIMPYVLEAYGSCVHQKLHVLGIAAGVCDKRDSHELGAKKMIEAIKELNARMAIPAHVAEIRKEDISEMAHHAEKEANPLYPVPKLMTAKELEQLYFQIGGIE